MRWRPSRRNAPVCQVHTQPNPCRPRDGTSHYRSRVAPQLRDRRTEGARAGRSGCGSTRQYGTDGARGLRARHPGRRCRRSATRRRPLPQRPKLLSRISCDHSVTTGVAASANSSPKSLLTASGCRDLNPGPLDPQSSALTKLRHSPFLLRATLCPVSCYPIRSVSPKSKLIAFLAQSGGSRSILRQRIRPHGNAWLRQGSTCLDTV